jgi:hypothetical protein
MAIDPLSETLISFAEATRELPARRGGKRPHVSCLYRWSVAPGCRGVVLETVQVGGTRCTSREALARFFARLTAGDSASSTPRSPARRERDSAAAARELDRLGA